MVFLHSHRDRGPSTPPKRPSIAEQNNGADTCCAICLELVDDVNPFLTPCCNQRFHEACLAAHKAASGRIGAGLFAPSAARCPLCRGDDETGLTPAARREALEVPSPNDGKLHSFETAHDARERAEELLDAMEDVIDDFSEPFWVLTLHTVRVGNMLSVWDTVNLDDRASQVIYEASRLAEGHTASWSSAFIDANYPVSSASVQLRREMKIVIDSTAGPYERLLEIMMSHAFTPPMRPDVFVSYASASRVACSALGDELGGRHLSPEQMHHFIEYRESIRPMREPTALPRRHHPEYALQHVSPTTARITLIIPPPPSKALAIKNAMRRWAATTKAGAKPAKVPVDLASGPPPKLPRRSARGARG